MGKIKYEPADIEIHIQEKGVVLKEKSLIAFDKVTCKVLAYGAEAESMTEMENVCVVSPMRQGMIIDYTVALEMFRHFIYKALGKKPLWKPRIALCVPQGITEVERKTIEDVMMQIGARELFITDFSMERFEMEMPKEYRQYKVIIGITKEKPESYISEELAGILEYARQQGISKERVEQLLRDAEME